MQTFAFGVGSLMIPLVMVFEGAGFTNAEGYVLLFVFLSVLSLSSTLLMFKISGPKRVKRHGVSLRKLFPHRSKDPLVRYVLAGGLIAFGAGLVVPLMAAWLGLLAAPFFLSGAFYIASISLFWYFFRKTKLPEDLID